MKQLITKYFKHFFVLFLLLNVVYSLEINSYIKQNKVYFGQNFQYNINVTYLKEENYQIVFPVDQTFNHFEIFGSAQKIINTISNNQNINITKYTYILKPKDIGHFSLPEITIEITKGSNSFYKTISKIPIIVNPPKKKINYLFILMIIGGVVLLVAIGFLIIFFINAKKKKTTTTQNNIISRYSNLIKQENKLKFKSDKKDYLAFLINIFKQAYNELKQNKFIDTNNQKFAEEIFLEENNIKFSHNNDKINIDYVDKIEKFFKI